MNQGTVKFFNDIPNGPFTDEPVKIPKERYEEAIAFLVSKWSSLPSRPVSIYQIGQVGVPGISDLDFVIVFRSGIRIDWRDYQPEVFPLWVQQMLTHPPYCCTEETWPELPAWYPTFNMRHLFGQVLQEPSLPPDLSSGCALGMLVDYLVVKVPRDFIWISLERPLRLRTLLTMLHSLKYTLKLAETAGIDSLNGKQIIYEVDALRASWFELDSQERLLTLAQLSERVCSITGELIQNVNEKIMAGLKGDLIAIPKPRGKTELFLFDSNWAYESAISKAFETYKQSGEIVLTNPESFLQVLGIYSDESPLFKKYFVRHGCKPRLSWDGGVWDKGLRYHARAMITYSESAAKLGVPPQRYVALGYYAQPSLWQQVQISFGKKLKGVLGIIINNVSACLTSPKSTYHLGEPFFWLLGMRWKNQNVELSKVKKVLVVRLDEIGDVVMTTPFLRELRRNIPEAWITLVVKPAIYNLVELCPYVNEVLTYDWNIQGRFATGRLHGRALKLAWKHLWRHRFDMAIVPRWDADYYHASFVAYFSGALWRVGYSESVNEYKKQYNRSFDLLFTHVLDDRNLKHEVERSLDIIRFIGGKVEDRKLELFVSDEDEGFIKNKFSENKVRGEDILFIFAPSGGNSSLKQWPLTNFIELGKWLLRKNYRIIVVGGEGEEELGYEIISELGPSVIHMVGKTSLRQLVALLKNSQFYIGNDSGVTHIAAAVNIPTIAIWGGSCYHRFAPWGKHTKIVHNELPCHPCLQVAHKDRCSECIFDIPKCLTTLSVVQVKNAVENMLSTVGHQ